MCVHSILRPDTCFWPGALQVAFSTLTAAGTQTQGPGTHRAGRGRRGETKDLEQCRLKCSNHQCVECELFTTDTGTDTGDCTAQHFHASGYQESAVPALNLLPIAPPTGGTSFFMLNKAWQGRRSSKQPLCHPTAMPGQHTRPSKPMCNKRILQWLL